MFRHQTPLKYDSILEAIEAQANVGKFELLEGTEIKEYDWRLLGDEIQVRPYFDRNWRTINLQESGEKKLFGVLGRNVDWSLPQEIAHNVDFNGAF